MLNPIKKRKNWMSSWENFTEWICFAADKLIIVVNFLMTVESEFFGEEKKDLKINI